MEDEKKLLGGEDAMEEFSSSECESNFGLGIHKFIPSQCFPNRRMSGPTRRSTKGGWTESEDKLLIAAVKKFNGKSWKNIAASVPGRTDVQCLHRWQKVLNPELIKGSWTKEEDDLLSELVMKNGNKNWSHVAKSLPGRIGKQCRERWYNHLNPEIKKCAWSKEEELILIETHQIYGNSWAEIAKFLHGRSENAIKNHWNCSMKKRLDLNVSMDTSKSNNMTQSLESKIDYDDTTTPNETSIESCEGHHIQLINGPINNYSNYNLVCNNPSNNSREETLDSGTSMVDILGAWRAVARKFKDIPSILRRK